jgi:hypothetical protein
MLQSTCKRWKRCRDRVSLTALRFGSFLVLSGKFIIHSGFHRGCYICRRTRPLYLPYVLSNLRLTVVFHATQRWTFSPLSKDAMMGAIWAAIGTYRHEKLQWAGIMQRGMSQDYSWDKAALQYEQVFEWAMIDLPYAQVSVLCPL